MGYSPKISKLRMWVFIFFYDQAIPNKIFVARMNL
jgi:hypothetical protein